MSHHSRRIKRSSDFMNQFPFCQVITEADARYFEVSATATKKNTQRGIAQQQRMPVRRRNQPTPSPTPAAPGPVPNQRSIHAKPSAFFPPPPPMFGGTTGGTAASASPALLIDPSTGNSFHPDFMFCGACTDCQEDDRDETATPLFGDEESSDSDSADSSSDDGHKAFLQTTVQLHRTKDHPNDSAINDTVAAVAQRQQHLHNEMLVMRSLIEAIPGVRKLTVPSTDGGYHSTKSNTNGIRLPPWSLDTEHIVVRHDASVHTETILHALESAGYSGSSVQSTRPTATRNHQSNMNGSAMSNPLNTLSNAVTPRTQSRTNDTSSNDDTASWVRSSFDVEGICCASEIPAIRRIVKPLWGVAMVNINLTTKVVHVQHNYDQIEASQIARALTNQGFPARVQRDGAASAQFSGQNRNNSDQQEAVDARVAEILDRIGPSTYVESTLTVEGLRADQVHSIEKAVSDSFIRVQVRAIYPSAVSETIKVEHNPELVSIEEIRDFLQGYSINKSNRGSQSFPSTAEVYIDGADANLYLPSEEDYPNNYQNNEPMGCIAWLRSYHVNVWLSGCFWILGMLSIADRMDHFKYFGLASVLFGLPPIILKAYRTLKRFQFDANCMMVTAALGALAMGEYDEAASVSFLFAVSEFLEARAAAKARKALSEICALRPDHANVIHPVSKEIIVVPADRVPLGALISVRTGDKIAADGIVVEGSTSIDESSLTGESTPVHKNIGDEVSGGTINIGQTQLVVKTKTTVEDSAVSRLIRLVEEAQSNRSPTEMMVDSFARSYTPSIIVIATIMCTIPWYFGTEIGREWTMKGLIIVVIACPCALTISTPVTYAAGLAATAKRGVIIKGGAKLEAMGSVDRIVFDKTGTLTKGKFSVTHMEVIGRSKTRQEMLGLLSLMQERASHPIASSLVQTAKNEGVQIPRQKVVTEHQILKGEGITAKVDGQVQLYVGNQRLFNRLGMFDLLSSTHKITVEEWEDTGGTVGFIGSRVDGIIGMFCVKDSVREEVKEALDELKEASIDIYMCTGDSDTTAQAVGEEVGIPVHRINSQLLPEDKLRFVEGLRRPEPRKFALCRKKQYVLFCGDGVNDAPALAAVDIGVSMGEGAAMALEMSDVTLMDSRLTKLPYVIQMGQRVLRTVKENIIISFVAKFLVVVLTFMGKMTLLYAIASDVGVMLLVTLNGMKLLPNERFDRMKSKRSRRARAIAREKGSVGKNTDFELIHLNSELVSTNANEPPSSLIDSFDISDIL